MNAVEIGQLSVVLTYNCNLKCKYCFVSDKGIYDTIDVSTVKLGVEMWKKVFSGGKNKLGILFTGGEPLLKKRTLFSIIDELERHFPEIQFEFHITTNGTLLTEDFLSEIEHRNVFLCVSIDGDEGSNEERLNGANALYDIIEQNIIIYAKRLDAKRFRVRMTITPNNVGHFYENIKHLVKLGVKNVHYSPNYEECWNDNNIEAFFEAHQQLGNFCCEGIILEPFQSFKKNGLKKQGPYEHDCSFMPTINTTGDVYYCPRYAGKRLEKLGHVSNPQGILLNFRKLVSKGQGISLKEGFSFICPSNYLENKNVILNFRRFYNMYKLFYL
jgi:uncharacterized protein